MGTVKWQLEESLIGYHLPGSHRTGRHRLGDAGGAQIWAVTYAGVREELWNRCRDEMGGVKTTHKYVRTYARTQTHGGGPLYFWSNWPTNHQHGRHMLMTEIHRVKYCTEDIFLIRSYLNHWLLNTIDCRMSWIIETEGVYILLKNKLKEISWDKIHSNILKKDNIQLL